MDNETYVSFLCNTIRNALQASLYVFYNIQSFQSNKLSIIEMMYSMRDKYSDTIIWDKITASPAMHDNILNSMYEYIHIFSEDATRRVGAKYFRSTVPNIVRVQKQRNNTFSHIHKATFPMELALYMVDNFAENSVLDIFGGTGTTLMACEQLNKKCYMMELDEMYCDVILQRWEQQTNKKVEICATR